MALLVVLSVLSVVAIIAALRAAVLDGRGPVPPASRERDRSFHPPAAGL